MMMMMTHDSANHTQPIRNRTPIHRTKIGLPKNDAPHNAKPVNNRYKAVHMHDLYISQSCHFRPMTQHNPLKTTISDPFPTQPKPTQFAGQPNLGTTLCAPQPTNNTA